MGGALNLTKLDSHQFNGKVTFFKLFKRLTMNTPSKLDIAFVAASMLACGVMGAKLATAGVKRVQTETCEQIQRNLSEHDPKKETLAPWEVWDRTRNFFECGDTAIFDSRIYAEPEGKLGFGIGALSALGLTGAAVGIAGRRKKNRPKDDKWTPTTHI